MSEGGLSLYLVGKLVDKKKLKRDINSPLA